MIKSGLTLSTLSQIVDIISSGLEFTPCHTKHTKVVPHKTIFKIYLSDRGVIYCELYIIGICLSVASVVSVIDMEKVLRSRNATVLNYTIPRRNELKRYHRVTQRKLGS